MELKVEVDFNPFRSIFTGETSNSRSHPLEHMEAQSHAPTAKIGALSREHNDRLFHPLPRSCQRFPSRISYLSFRMLRSNGRFRSGTVGLLQRKHSPTFIRQVQGTGH